MEMSTLESLRAPVEGDVIAPGDAGFEDARTIWNAMIDRRPAVVVRPRGADDVVEAIAFAREHDLPIAVRGGGHNVAGNAVVDEGVVIDFSDMRAVEVDPDRGVVRVEAGALLSDVDAAVAAEVKSAIEKAKTVLDSDDAEKITTARNELEQSAHKLAEALYKKAQQQGTTASSDADASAGGASANGGKGDDDNVVDADFEEVKP